MLKYLEKLLMLMMLSSITSAVLPYVPSKLNPR